MRTVFSFGWTIPLRALDLIKKQKAQILQLFGIIYGLNVVTPVRIMQDTAHIITHTPDLTSVI